MLSTEEIALRVARKNSLAKASLGVQFANSTLDTLQTLHSFGENREKVRQTAASALDTMDETYSAVTQNDLTRAMLAGIDVNSGTVAQIAAQRKNILNTEKQRLNDERTRALVSISNQENTSILQNIGSFALKAIEVGVMAWLM